MTTTDHRRHVRIDRRLNGPRRSANGGFAAGTFAALVGGTAQVSLRQRPTLDRDLPAVPGLGGTWAVHDRDRLVATVRPVAPFVSFPPVRPTYSEAWDARRRHPFIGVRHALSDCVVCSPTRADGLHVTPGPLASDPDVLAAPYLPRDDLPDTQLWAALDCVSYPASLLRLGRVALLASLAVHQVGELRFDERYVAVGWTRSSGTRSHQTSSAVLDEDGEVVASADAVWVELGRRLGLYVALYGDGPASAADLAGRTGIAVRYAQEFLDQQAAAGILDVVDDVIGDERRFVLPDGHAAVLLDPESPAHLIGVAPALLGVAIALPAVADAYITGGGVEFGDFGDDLRFGIGSVNRPGFVHETRAWVQTLPEVAARLEHRGVILDAGCGEGWSTIGLATAFPRATVVGIDLDHASVVQARANVAASGLTDRVRIVEGNASDGATLHAALGGPADLVTVFEALHDMGEPVRALTAYRGLLADGGAVLVADHHGEDDRPAPAGEAERMALAISVLHCLPATCAESTAVANGTVLRAATLRRWVGDAGFERLEVLPVEHPFWRFYGVS